MPRIAVVARRYIVLRSGNSGLEGSHATPVEVGFERRVGL